MQMHKSMNIFLINDDVIGCVGIYEPDHEHAPNKHVLLKTMDKTVVQGDLVVVPTKTNNRWDFTIMKVIKADVEPDFDSSEECRWIVGKAPIDAYKVLKAQEEEANEVIAAAQRKRKREELARDITGLDEVQVLAIANKTVDVPAS
jgi:hypothetical protein